MNAAIKKYGGSVDMREVLAANNKNRKDPNWRKRTGFANIYTKRIWATPSMVAGLRSKGIHLGILALLCLTLSSCANQRDLVTETNNRLDMDLKIVQTMDRMADSMLDGTKKTVAKLNNLEDRVTYLESLAAPGDPDGLGEIPAIDFDGASEVALCQTDLDLLDDPKTPPDIRKMLTASVRNCANRQKAERTKKQERAFDRMSERLGHK
jgi:hypothetical protein